MILNSNNATIAYRCPECGDTVFSIANVFSLSGDMIRIICKNCRGSVLTLTGSSDGKARLSVPCLACPKPHNFTLALSSLFSDKERVICLPCPYTGIDICFVGEKEKVIEALEKSDKALIELMNEAGIGDFQSIRGEDYDEDDEDDEEGYDPMVEDIVSFVIADLAADNAITCGCPDGQGHYAHRFYKDKLIVFCENCKCAREIRMTGITDANKFLELDSLALKDDRI